MQIRKEIEEALFDLLAVRKSLKTISITELSEHAQISRRTFYRYYRSKEQVLTNYANRLIEHYIKTLQSAQSYSFQQLIAVFFHYWTTYQNELKILQEANLLTFFLHSYDQQLLTIYTSIMAPWHVANSHDKQVIYDSRYIVGALSGILEEWLRSDDYQVISVEDLIAIAIDSNKRLQ
ncbi:transcriptional regulator [Streptococcus criceti]|uniref:HTH tetR-type domain-containing protein n=1 Tax=Streptococcus criceti HS-6 TaxID=873449 RepID=G5JQ11_STRCG|nr:TetR/AcrR family transcriptional regulator [Streptococcus criceti]EHI74025.1 hypothetical protein STRCR_0458 [Streptococcus criceti HS-6]SUN41919.1 transcriptional regulator [Streptococcus criceti]